MIRRITWTSIGVVLIVAGISSAWTQTQQWHGGHSAFWFHRGPVGYFVHALNLSDPQKSQIKSIWEGERPHVAELIHELVSEQKEMDALTFQSGTPDDARIKEIVTRQGDTFAQLFAEKEKLTGEIYSQVLNPAQRAKADELRQHLSSHLDHIADRIGNPSRKR